MLIQRKIREKLVEKSFLFVWLCFLLPVLSCSSRVAFAVDAPNQLDTALSRELKTSSDKSTEFFTWADTGMMCQGQWLVTVYNGLGIHPLWVTENGPTEQARQLLAILRNAETEGLNASDYGVNSIVSLWLDRTPSQLARLDLNMSLGLLTFIYDMREGRLAPRLQNSKLFDQAGCVIFDPLASLSKARDAIDITAYLASLAPRHHHYRVLKEQLKSYREISRMGGWPHIESGKTIHPGTSDVKVADIRKLLIITGDLEATTEIHSNVYDEELEHGVKTFQDRHGLEVDGVIGKNTFAALGVSVEKRIQQILINMERWRWTERDLGTKYVLIDIAGFQLHAVVDDVVMLQMRVIVGKQHHETPVFSDSIKYLDFNPFWNITPDIAKNEMLEELRKDSNYLESKHIRLFSNWQADGVELDPHDIDWNEVSKKQIGRYKLRQDPGPWNALGVVKFVFPNKYSVYMHDTPGRDLFKQPTRAFSHGCIRLSKPKQLAGFLLGDTDATWTPERIEETISTNTRKVVRLKRAVPVHIVYQTAWGDKEGRIHFNKDLYGRDQQLTQALFGE